MEYEGLTIEYLCYLMNRIGLEAEGAEGYLRLCETLQETEFVPQTDMDENRCVECRNLRSDFACDDYGVDCLESFSVMDVLDGEYGGNGTMLELLIVLSEKMAYEMSDSQYEAPPRKWFLEMLQNCGIDQYWWNQTFYDHEGTEEAIKDILYTVIFRKTGWDGEGGFFPLSYAQYDQRKVEIIIQMNNYIEEHYDIC